MVLKKTIVMLRTHIASYSYLNLCFVECEQFVSLLVSVLVGFAGITGVCH